MNQAKPKIRLYVPQPFHASGRLALAEGQSHYLAHVMRGKEGEAVAVFNGSDGEWLAKITAILKKSVTLELERQLVPQTHSPDLWLVFAPIKNKTDSVVEKATELGVSALLPVLTRYSVVRSVNHDKLVAHAQEAAEQSERCDVPRIEACRELPTLLASWPQDRLLLYGDESGGGVALKPLLNSLPFCARPSPLPLAGGAGGGNLSACSELVERFPHPASPVNGGGEGRGKYALLIGPEGGFSAEEHRMLKQAPFVRPFGMGPRILRADTAAIAALACLQMWLGDWDIQLCHPALVAGSGSTTMETPQQVRGDRRI